MMIFFFIFYRSIVTLKDRYVSNLPTFFHFDKNGSYHLFSRNKNIIINYFICNKTEFNLFQKDSDHNEDNCYEHNLKIDDFDKGKIKDKGGYQFVFNKNKDYNTRRFQSKNLKDTPLSQASILDDSNNNNNFRNIHDKNNKFVKKLKNSIFDFLNFNFFKQNIQDDSISSNINENIIESFNSINERSSIQKDATEKNEVVVIFQNPKTFLDMNVYPCLITKPLFASIMLLILILWLINWIMNFTNSCSIHIFLTLIIVDLLFYFYFQSKELYFRNHSDLFTPYMPLRITFFYVYQVLFFSTILMLAKGWFIVHKSIGKLKIMYCFLYSILLALPQLMFQTNFINKALGASLIRNKKDELCADIEISNGFYFDFLTEKLIRFFFSDTKTLECNDISLWTTKVGWNFAFIGIGFVGVIFYYRDLLMSIEQSSEYVIAHLMVISESGIDPCTTPIMEKYVIYKCLSWEILFYLGSQQFAILINQFCENCIAFWVQQLFYDIVSLFSIIGASFILKLNKKRLNGFMQLPANSDNSEVEKETNIVESDENPQSRNINEHFQFNDNVFDSIENNAESNTKESGSTEMNLENIAHDNVYHHVSVRITKRVVSRDEIKKFNISIDHRNRSNSNLDALDDNLNDNENPNDNANKNQSKMVKWEEWMELPPQPIVSGAKRTPAAKVPKIRGNINDNENANNNGIEDELIHLYDA